MDSEFEKKQTILIVDDSADSLALMNSMLKSLYRIKVAVNGEKAIQIAQDSPPPDLILLDILMPEMDGYETCRRLKGNQKTADIPVIFLTAKTEEFDEEMGLEIGAEDYITKPPCPATVKARIRGQLRLKGVRDFLKEKSAYLEAEVNRRTQEIAQIQDVAMIAMGSLAETRDNETGNHIRRTQNYIKILAERLSERDKYKDILTHEMINRLYKSAPLHDIGKVGIPDTILKKPDKLTRDEFEIMKRHTTIGKDAIMAAEQSLGSQTSFLSLARDIAWSHHEKWDGSGYPRGLSGEQIPLAGRLMAIPDVYDALISDRVYKKAIPHAETVEMIRAEGVSHYDPEILSVFLEVVDQFDAIARKFRDREEAAK
jgi:putative two-component system response regulator